MILWSDVEILSLLRDGVQVQVYAEAGDSVTKGEVEARVDEIVGNVSVETARRVTSLKVAHSEVSVLTLLGKEVHR